MRVELTGVCLLLGIAAAACGGGGSDGGGPDGGIVLRPGGGGAGGRPTGGSGGAPGTGGAPGSGGAPATPPAPSCKAAASGGRATAAAPTLLLTLKDRAHEGWLASPSVADLDRDGKPEIVLPREGRVVVFGGDGALAWTADVPGRIWPSAVVGDFVGDAGLEVAVAARANVFLFDARGKLLPGFPAAWRNELRSLAGGDLDGDGRPELVAATTTWIAANGGKDILQAFRGDGSVLRGFPPNATGASGCAGACFVAGAYDQNLALGPLDADGAWDVVAPHDNAYISWHKGSGAAFDSAPIFKGRPKVPGIRFLHSYAEAQLGDAADEATANQAHFTNSAPAIADLDGDGKTEIVVLGSTQNALQTDRKRGVSLWVVNADGTRPPAWVEPLHLREYLAGLDDFEGTNVVGATNQVAIAELDPAAPGLEIVFAGFDGKIHAVGADRKPRWSYAYTTTADVLTGGVAIADLSGDGAPEIAFATYSPRKEAGALFVLGGNGALQHKLPLPDRGAMAVPTVADVNGDGAVEIVVNLKDALDRARTGLVFTVPGSHAGCRPWPTGRGNDLRNGYAPRSR